jgi:hypothetical protein
MSKYLILKEKIPEDEVPKDTLNDFPVKVLKQQNAAYFILKALICLLIALMTLYIYVVLRLYTLPKFYEHNCKSVVPDLNTFHKNEFHIIL